MKIIIYNNIFNFLITYILERNTYSKTAGFVYFVPPEYNVRLIFKGLVHFSILAISIVDLNDLGTYRFQFKDAK